MYGMRSCMSCCLISRNSLRYCVHNICGKRTVAGPQLLGVFVVGLANEVAGHDCPVDVLIHRTGLSAAVQRQARQSWFVRTCRTITDCHTPSPQSCRLHAKIYVCQSPSYWLLMILTSFLSSRRGTGLVPSVLRLRPDRTEQTGRLPERSSVADITDEMSAA